MPAVAAAGVFATYCAGPGPRKPAVGATHPRVSFTGCADVLRTNARLPRRIRARGTVAASAPLTLTSSDGGGVAVVGLGARGCAVVDRLVAKGGLPNAQFWSLSADANALQSALAPNRWRLPPGNVDPTATAVEENAAAAARGILNGGNSDLPPNVLVVIASASEARGVNAVVLREIAKVKDGVTRGGGWFTKGGSQGITHAGPVLIVSVMTPFAFEGPRKTTDAIDLLREAQKYADAVTVVPQENLTSGVSANGDPLTVTEVTQLADATVQWSAWTVLEMLRSPAWIGLDGAASESSGERARRNKNRPWRYEKVLSPETFRALVVGRPNSNAKNGCGVVVVGYGTASLELNFSQDDGQSAAIRTATATAAETSPFLPSAVFRECEFIVMSIQTSASLTETAVRCASDTLADLVGANVPQIITHAKPDPRAPPDQILVTLLVSTAPEVAAARNGSKSVLPKKKDSKKFSLGMSFPAIPGMSTRVSVESVGLKQRTEREARESQEKQQQEANRPAQKLTGDMLRKLGLGDPGKMVEEHQEGHDELMTPSAEVPGSGVEGKSRLTGLLRGEEGSGVSRGESVRREAGGEGGEGGSGPSEISQKKLPPLPMPPKRATQAQVPDPTALPMPAPQDVQKAVAVPETRAEAGAKFMFEEVEEEDVEVEDVEVEDAEDFPETETVAHDSDSAVGENKPGVAATDGDSTLPGSTQPGDARERKQAQGTVGVGADRTGQIMSVPLPPGIGTPQVPLRIRELEEDPLLLGQVIGYKPLAAGDGGFDDDFDDDDVGDIAAAAAAASSVSIKQTQKKVGLFGWGSAGGGGSDDSDQEVTPKDAVKHRLASVLDRDRSGTNRRMVRVEYQGDATYQGEWFDNKSEGTGQMEYGNGDVYEGRWAGGVPNGRGVLRYKNGGSFDGAWRGGIPNGAGVLDVDGKEVVDGRWVEGKICDAAGLRRRGRRALDLLIE